MRIAAIHLPLLRVEIARARTRGADSSAPIAVVIARESEGKAKDERSLLGGTRLDAVSPEARAWRVQRGETIASARAKCAGLFVRIVAEGEVRGALESVAECGLEFGRTASIDEARDIVMFDVTGCAHLFGGESALARTLLERVREMHHGDVRVCIADGPRVSSAIACAMRRDAPFVVSEGNNNEAIRALPIDALPLDEKTLEWLRRLGLARVADLQKLPARGLATRLGAAHAEVMALLAGDDAMPLVPYVPKEVPEERAELEYGIDKSEALVFVAKTLCDRMGARLAGRAIATTKLEVELSLDRAVAREAELPARASIDVSSPAPLSTASEMLSLVRTRLESWTLVAPVLAVTLRATELVRKDGKPLDLFEPMAKAERTLPRLVAELSADLGVDGVGVLALADTWLPEARTLLRPFVSGVGGSSAGHPSPTHLVSTAPEPSRVITSSLPVGEARLLQLLSRVEACEWWRLGPYARDSFAAWIERDARLAWTEVDLVSGKVCVKGWFD